MPASPDDDLTLAARKRVGRTLRQKWRLDALIGTGGMAAVYAATHRNGNRAAVKVLHDELSAVGEIKSRFLREAYVANKVAHPGAVRVIDDDTDEDGTSFLVMDLLEGETLAQRLEKRSKRLFAAEVCKIADAVLDVLGAAHEKSIVHRDVKPENVFLTKDGGTRLLDFGFARVLDAAQQSSALTGVRTTLGTPAFMPPEQAAGKWSEVDGRSDLWALGATMFFALSGEHVHEGESLADVLVAAATKPARSLRLVAPHLPSSVVAVVERALAFEKPMRWPNARAMQQAVRDAARSASLTSASKSSADDAPPSSDNDATLIVDNDRTFIVADEPTLRPPPKGVAAKDDAPPRASAAPPRPAAGAPPRPAAGPPRPGASAPPRPAAGAPAAPRAASGSITAPSAAAVPPRATPRSQQPEIDDDSVSETMLAVMLDRSGAPRAGMARISDVGPPSVPAPPDSAPGSRAGRVIVETTPYAAPDAAPVVPEEVPLPRGFRRPQPSSPFWEQSASGVNPAPTPAQLGEQPLPAPQLDARAQQPTVPAIGGTHVHPAGGRAQVDDGPSNRPMLIVAGAAGFLFILFAGMIAFLFLR